MSQEIEIEFKNLITKEEYNKIKHIYSFPQIPVEQTNFYFDTPDLSLKEHHSALRIRKKKDVYHLTLKETIQEGILETHDILEAEEVKHWIENQPISKPNVANQLKKMNIDINQLTFFGELITKRMEYHHNQLTYVLDESHYNNHSDYELEIESTTYNEGLQAFNNLLDQLKIPKRTTPNKIQRFFSTINSQ